jgi:hypothetical protein
MKKYYGWTLDHTEKAIEKMKAKHEAELKAVAELMLKRIQREYGIELELYLNARQYHKPCFFVAIKIKKTLKEVFELRAEYKQNESWGFRQFFLGDFIGYVADCYEPQNANPIYGSPLKQTPTLNDLIELENILIQRLGKVKFIKYLQNEIEL